ncbi:putative rna-directed dna polymerase from mobile element jockey-like protein [Trichonephila clavipes]|nr:putative rna-directed dna polymerase from mobile element jockey-like protein [Trichonephila clavipes]
MLFSNGVSVNTIPDIANTLAETFAKTSSWDNHTPAFQALKRREERGITHHINQGIQWSLYVDDVQISYSSKFLNVAERHIQTTINNFTKWAEQNGFVFSTEKTVLYLTNLSDSIVIQKISKSEVCAKALNILKILANTRWEADRTSLLRLYRALISSKLDYGSVVYSSACKSILKILDPVHHQALRLCLGAFRTSPVESLYAEAYEPH